MMGVPVHGSWFMEFNLHYPDGRTGAWAGLQTLPLSEVS